MGRDAPRCVLQERGHDVLAIDRAPLAIRTVRLRGVRQARVLPVTALSRRLGSFDTLLLLGNNFGLLANARRARWLLARFASLTPDKSSIVAEVLDPFIRSIRIARSDQHTSTILAIARPMAASASQP